MLGVDLYELWRAGRVGLPEVAGVYRRAVQALERVRHDDEDWGALQRQVVSVLAAAGRQVEEAAEAVCAAAEEYARTDAGVRHEFERLRSQRGPDR